MAVQVDIDTLDSRGQSSRGLEQSKTLRDDARCGPARQRLGLRRPSAAFPDRQPNCAYVNQYCYSWVFGCQRLEMAEKLLGNLNSILIQSFSDDLRQLVGLKGFGQKIDAIFQQQILAGDFHAVAAGVDHF